MLYKVHGDPSRVIARLQTQFKGASTEEKAPLNEIMGRVRAELAGFPMTGHKIFVVNAKGIDQSAAELIAKAEYTHVVVVYPQPHDDGLEVFCFFCKETVREALSPKGMHLLLTREKGWLHTHGVWVCDKCKAKGRIVELRNGQFPTGMRIIDVATRLFPGMEEQRMETYREFWGKFVERVKNQGDADRAKVDRQKLDEAVELAREAVMTWHRVLAAKPAYPGRLHLGRLAACMNTLFSMHTSFPKGVADNARHMFFGMAVFGAPIEVSTSHPPEGYEELVQRLAMLLHEKLGPVYNKSARFYYPQNEALGMIVAEGMGNALKVLNRLRLIGQIPLLPHHVLEGDSREP